MAVRPNPPQHAPAPVSPQGTGGLSLVPAGAHQGKPALPLTRTFTLIGSRNRAHLHLVSPTVSKSHTAVIATGNSLYVRDLASRTHTIVNGRAVREAELKHGDKLVVGNFQFRIDAKAIANAKPSRRAPKSSLLVDGATFPIPVEGHSLLIGRRPTCDVPLVEESVSTVHALVFEVNGYHYVRDLGSRTGTLVNGKPIHQHPLSFGDELRIGDTVMRYAPESGKLEKAAPAVAAEAAAPAYAPPPVPKWEGAAAATAAPIEEDLTVAADEADELLPVAPVAERSAPASEADNLIPLADEEQAEAAPVGNWDRVRTSAPARPAEPELEPIDVESAAAEAIAAPEPVAEGAPAELDELDLGVVTEEPAVAVAADSRDAVPAAEEVAAADDLGLDFAEVAESEPVKASAPGEPGELDLSGLSLEPVAADDAPPTAATIAPVGLAPAVLAEALPAVMPLAEAPSLDVEVPSPSKGSKKKPAAAKKEKQSWWGRKKKQQQEAPPAPAPDVAAEEPPLAPAASASASPVADDAPITGDDLSFLDDILAAESAEQHAGTEASHLSADVIEPIGLTDVNLAGEAGAVDLDVDTDLDVSAAAETKPVDTLAGLDFSNLATGSGLDLGGVVDTVDLSTIDDADTELEAILPPQAPLAEAASAEDDEFLPLHGDAEARAVEHSFELPESLDETTVTSESPVAAITDTGEVLDFTEPTPESALDLTLPDNIAEADDVGTPVDDSSLSDTTFGRAVEAMGDPDLAPVDEVAERPAEVTHADVDAAVLPTIDEDVEAPSVAAETQADGLDALVAAETGPEVASGDPAFDDVLDEALGSDATPAVEPSLHFDLGAEAPAAQASAPADESPALSFDANDEPYQTQADKLIAATLAGDDVTPSDEEVVDLAADEPAALAATPPDEEFISDDLSADTLAVAEPEAEPVAETEEMVESDEDIAPSPFITDLTSPTEDVASPEVAAQPADFSEDDALDALEFDLEPTAEAEQPAATEFAAAVSADEETVDLDALSTDASPELASAVDDASFEAVDEDVPQIAEAPAPQAMPPAEPRPAAPKAFDPFMGMGRDSGTFIGGMPLPLPPLTPVNALGGAAAALPASLSAAAAKLPPPELVESVDDLPLTLEGLSDDPVSPPANASAEVGALDLDADIEAIDFTTEPVEDDVVVPPPAPAPAAEVRQPQVQQTDAKGRTIPKPPPAARNIPPRNMPLPERRPATGPFDLGLGDGAVEIPPFNRSAPGERPKAGPLTTAFDGLALDDEEEGDDVFSALGPSSDPIFGLPSRPLAPKATVGQSPAVPASKAPVVAPAVEKSDDVADDQDDDLDSSGGTGGGSAIEEDVALAETVGDAPSDLFPDEEPVDVPVASPVAKAPLAAPTGKAAGRRPPGYTPPPADAAANVNPPAAPPKKRRWGVRFLLPIMFLCAGLAVVAVYALQPRFYPRTAEVSGYIEFVGLDQLSEGERRAESDRQRELVKALQDRAREVLIGKDEKLDPGFLGSATDQDVAAYEAIVKSVRVLDRSNKLAIYHHGHDHDGDRVRMLALLEALYTKNASLGDDVATKNGEYEKAQADLYELVRKVNELKPRVEVGRKQDDQYVAALDAKAAELKANDDKLTTDLSKARLLAKDMEAEFDRAVAANGADSGAALPQKGDGVAHVVNTAGTVDPTNDPQLKEMSQHLAELTAALEQSKVAKTAESQAAAAKLNEALAQFDKQIAAQSELKGSDQLAKYFDDAKNLQLTIRNVFERMAARQQVWSDRLTKRKARVAEVLEARIKEAWASDEQLKGLQETLSITEHHRNAASASGLTNDVGKLDKEIVAINAKIDAQRELVSARLASDSDEQEFINTALADLENERTEDGKAMAAVFENFQRQAPSVEKLPVEQQKLATALSRWSTELNTAREQYLKASAGESATDSKTVENEVAQTQAKIDARKRQLADAAAQDLPEQQRQERKFRVAQATTNLNDAKAALDRAENARTPSYKALDDAEKAASLAHEALARFKTDEAQLADLDHQRGEKLALVEKIDKERKGKVYPLAIDPVTAVTAVKGEDPRPLFSLIAAVSVFGLFSLLMFVTAHQPQNNADGEPEDAIAFATAAYAQQFAGEPPTSSPRFTEDIDEAAAHAAGVNGNGHAFDSSPDESPRVAV